jgi:S1-C subfamily serine protease
MLAVLTWADPARSQQGTAPEVPAELVSRVGGSVVRLSLRQGGEEHGNGTGFVVRSDGIVVTNHHVVEDAPADLVAVFRDGRRRKVLGSLALDDEHDLALIRIEGGGYPALPLAPAEGIRVGQQVFLVGSSSGLDQSLGTGVVSALRPEGFPDEWTSRYRAAGRQVVAGPIVQHTASSAPGSSGSPVVDTEGRVVAIHHSGVFGFPIYFGAHADALRGLMARTDLDARPAPLGPDVFRNLMISAAVFAAIFALFALPALLQRRKRSSQWRAPGR